MNAAELAARLAEALRHTLNCRNRIDRRACPQCSGYFRLLGEYDLATLAAPAVPPASTEEQQRADCDARLAAAGQEFIVSVDDSKSLTSAEIEALQLVPRNWGSYIVWINDRIRDRLTATPAAVPPDIAEAREVLSKMTPGEWSARVRFGVEGAIVVQGESVQEVGNNFALIDDAAGIAYLKNNAAAWLDRLAASEAENERLKALAADDPDNDCTPFQHPAFTRGDEHSHKVFCQLANEIMDGKEPGGTCSEPWESTRQRIAALARLRSVPEKIEQIAYCVLEVAAGASPIPDPPIMRWAEVLARFIRDGANGGKQLAGIHYNPQDTHDGPP